MLSMWLLAVVVTLVAGLLLSLARRSASYWSRRGVPGPKSLPLLGNYLPVLTLSKTSAQIYTQLYDDYPEEKAVGLMEFTNPTLILRDPRLIEEVLVKDFSSYPDHGPFIFEPSSGLHLGLFNLYGDRWRALRNKLLSTFTTGRMREMYPGIVACSEELLASRPESLDREAMSQFAVDSFLRALFGARLTPPGQPDFRQRVRLMFQAPLFRYIQQQFLIFYPKLGEFFNMKYMSSEMDNYFRSIVNTILHQREDTGAERRDFTDLLLQISSFKNLNIFSRMNNKTEKIFDVRNELVVSQGFMFFFAGMDTTSLTMFYTALELAGSPEAQDKARQEVRRLLRKHGALTYDAVREMKYMEQCIQEALRLHPPLTFLMRVADRATRLGGGGGGGLELEAGTRLILPIHSLQLDPKYFPQPLVFRPDRFQESSSWEKFAHLPFSEGPRVCVGKKFSIVEISTLMAHLLLKYELSIDPKSKLPLEYEERTVFLTPKHPVLIRLHEIHSPSHL